MTGQGTLPASWLHVPLADIADVQLGKMLSAKSRTGRGAHPYLRNINVRWGRIDVDDVLHMDFDAREVDKYELREGDVVVCEGGEPGRAAIWRNQLPGALYQKALHRVRFWREIVDPRYFVYHLEFDAATGVLARRFTGSTIKHLPREAFLQYEMRVPPVVEQRRIVAAIEEHLSDVDAAVAALDRARANVRRFRASVLAMLTDDPSARWPRTPLTALLSALPRPLQSGPFGSNLLHSEFQNTGVLAIGIDNVGSGVFLPGRQHRISLEKYEALKKYTARPNDVLITVMATIGRCCVVPDDAEPAIITKHVYRITVDESIMAPRFLMYGILGAPSVRDQLFGKARGQTRPGLNSGILRQLLIPLPSRVEQNRIVAEIEQRLTVAKRTTAEIDIQLTRATRFRQSILKRAFEGKLVPQDSNEEPTSALLERIRAERAANNGKPNGSQPRRVRRRSAR